MKLLAMWAAALVVAMLWVVDEAAADAYTIEPVDRVMRVVKGANVRAGPGMDHPVRVALGAGTLVRVTGDVVGRNWLQVDLRGDGTASFMHQSLLEAMSAADSSKPSGSGWSVTRNQPCRVWNGGKGDEHDGYTWSGACVDGKASGEGRLVWRSRYGRNVYEGGMEAGRQQGTGTLRRSDGSRYVGEWSAGEQHGHGVYTWAIGHRYEGGWRRSRPHGHGVATFADGDVLEGEWRDGCYGERDGLWAALIASVEDCGFE